MAFTDHCGIYGAVNEEAFNRIAYHIMKQRPSLFNYGTQMFADDPDDLCVPVRPHPEVIKRGNPIVSVEDPLPVLGSEGLFGVNFCFQITEMLVDFAPLSRFRLPPELEPIFGKQKFAFKLRVCGAIACPDDRIADRYGEIVAREAPRLIELPGQKGDKYSSRDGKIPDIEIKDIPAGALECFCLDVFVVLHLEWVNVGGRRNLAMKLDGLEIVDVEPDGLENGLECYLATTLRVGILPRIRLAVETLVLDEFDPYATLTLSPTSISSSVPFNPSIDGDQIKVYIDVEVS